MSHVEGYVPLEALKHGDDHSVLEAFRWLYRLLMETYTLFETAPIRSDLDMMRVHEMKSSIFAGATVTRHFYRTFRERIAIEKLKDEELRLLQDLEWLLIGEHVPNSAPTKVGNEEIDVVDGLLKSSESAEERLSDKLPRFNDRRIIHGSAAGYLWSSPEDSKSNEVAAYLEKARASRKTTVSTSISEALNMWNILFSEFILKMFSHRADRTHEWLRKEYTTIFNCTKQVMREYDEISHLIEELSTRLKAQLFRFREVVTVVDDKGERTEVHHVRKACALAEEMHVDCVHERAAIRHELTRVIWVYYKTYCVDAGEGIDGPLEDFDPNDYFVRILRLSTESVESWSNLDIRRWVASMRDLSSVLRLLDDATNSPEKTIEMYCRRVEQHASAFMNARHLFASVLEERRELRRCWDALAHQCNEDAEGDLGTYTDTGSAESQLRRQLMYLKMMKQSGQQNQAAKFQPNIEAPKMSEEDAQNFSRLILKETLGIYLRKLENNLDVYDTLVQFHKLVRTRWVDFPTPALRFFNALVSLAPRMELNVATGQQWAHPSSAILHARRPASGRPEDEHKDASDLPRVPIPLLLGELCLLLLDIALLQACMYRDDEVEVTKDDDSDAATDVSDDPFDPGNEVAAEGHEIGYFVTEKLRCEWRRSLEIWSSTCVRMWQRPYDSMFGLLFNQAISLVDKLPDKSIYPWKHFTPLSKEDRQDAIEYARNATESLYSSRMDEIDEANCSMEKLFATLTKVFNLQRYPLLLDSDELNAQSSVVGWHMRMRTLLCTYTQPSVDGRNYTPLLFNRIPTWKDQVEWLMELQWVLSSTARSDWRQSVLSVMCLADIVATSKSHVIQEYAFFGRIESHLTRNFVAKGKLRLPVHTHIGLLHFLNVHMYDDVMLPVEPHNLHRYDPAISDTIPQLFLQEYNGCAFSLALQLWRQIAPLKWCVVFNTTDEQTSGDGGTVQPDESVDRYSLAKMVQMTVCTDLDKVEKVRSEWNSLKVFSLSILKNAALNARPLLHIIDGTYELSSAEYDTKLKSGHNVDQIFAPDDPFLILLQQTEDRFVLTCIEAISEAMLELKKRSQGNVTLCDATGGLRQKWLKEIDDTLMYFQRVLKINANFRLISWCTVKLYQEIREFVLNPLIAYFTKYKASPTFMFDAMATNIMCIILYTVEPLSYSITYTVNTKSSGGQSVSGQVSNLQPAPMHPQVLHLILSLDHSSCLPVLMRVCNNQLRLWARSTQSRVRKETKDTLSAAVGRLANKTVTVSDSNVSQTLKTVSSASLDSHTGAVQPTRRRKRLPIIERIKRKLMELAPARAVGSWKTLLTTLMEQLKQWPNDRFATQMYFNMEGLISVHKEPFRLFEEVVETTVWKPMELEEIRIDSLEFEEEVEEDARTPIEYLTTHVRLRSKKKFIKRIESMFQSKTYSILSGLSAALRRRRARLRQKKLMEQQVREGRPAGRQRAQTVVKQLPIMRFKKLLSHALVTDVKIMYPQLVTEFMMYVEEIDGKRLDHFDMERLRFYVDTEWRKVHPGVVVASETLFSVLCGYCWPQREWYSVQAAEGAGAWRAASALVTAADRARLKKQESKRRIVEIVDPMEDCSSLTLDKHPSWDGKRGGKSSVIGTSFDAPHLMWTLLHAILTDQSLSGPEDVVIKEDVFVDRMGNDNTSVFLSAQAFSMLDARAKPGRLDMGLQTASQSQHMSVRSGSTSTRFVDTSFQRPPSYYYRCVPLFLSDSFLEPLVAHTEGYVEIKQLNPMFCLNEFAQYEVPRDILYGLATLNVNDTLNDWILLIKRRLGLSQWDENMYTIFSAVGSDRPKSEHMKQAADAKETGAKLMTQSLPKDWYLPKGSVARVYDKLVFLTEYIRTEVLCEGALPLTMLDLLKLVNPYVGDVYEVVHKRFRTPAERWDYLKSGKYYSEGNLNYDSLHTLVNDATDSSMSEEGLRERAQLVQNAFESGPAAGPTIPYMDVERTFLVAPEKLALLADTVLSQHADYGLLFKYMVGTTQSAYSNMLIDQFTKHHELNRVHSTVAVLQKFLSALCWTQIPSSAHTVMSNGIQRLFAAKSQETLREDAERAAMRMQAAQKVVQIHQIEAVRMRMEDLIVQGGHSISPIGVRELSFERCTALTDAVLKATLLQSFACNIQFLDISYCEEVSQHCLGYISACCPYLTTLKANGLLISTFSFSSLDVSDYVHTFEHWYNCEYNHDAAKGKDGNLLGSRSPTPASQRHVVKDSPLLFRRLESLELRGCTSLTHVCIVAPSLQHLDSSSCPVLTSCQIFAPNLRTACLHSCSKLTNEGLAPLVRRSPELHTFILDNCPMIDYPHLKDKCPRLVLLDLSRYSSVLMITSEELINHKLTELRLTSMARKLCDSDLQLICESLRPRSILQVLDLSGNQITSEGIRYLGNAICATSDFLTELDVSDNVLDDDYDGDTIYFVTTLMNHPSLETLRMTNTKIGNNVATRMSDVILTCPKLMTVVLSDNYISDDGAAALAKAMQRQLKAQVDMFVCLEEHSICTSRPSYDEDAVDSDTDVSSDQRPVHLLGNLDLGKNGIGSEGFRSFCFPYPLMNFCNINVRHNQIGDDGFVAYSRSVISGQIGGNHDREAWKSFHRMHQNVKVVDFSWNHIGDEGMKALSVALKDNDVVSTLNLSHNEIGVSGGMTLAVTLLFNHTLTHIDLSWNNLRNAVMSISELIKVHKNLQFLSLAKNGVDAHGLRSLAAALLVNRSIVELDLSRNPLIENDHGIGEKSFAAASMSMVAEEALAMFVNALESNPVISKVDLRHTKLGRAGRDMMIELAKSTGKEILLE